MLAETLEDDAVHVWRADLDQPDERVAKLIKLLSDDERTRADAFKFDHLRRRSSVARGALRSILSHYLDVDAASIRFVYDAYGKPTLAYPPQALQFNVAHSGSAAVFAVVKARRVGVDVEVIRPLADLGAIAERFFSASERDALEQLSPDEKLQGFYACWTRKEAYIKAIGKGLSQPLDRFSVTVTPGEPPRLLWVEGDATATRRWMMADLQSPPDCVGALVVEGQNCRLCYQDAAPYFA